MEFINQQTQGHDLVPLMWREHSSTAFLWVYKCDVKSSRNGSWGNAPVQPTLTQVTYRGTSRHIYIYITSSTIFFMGRIRWLKKSRPTKGKSCILWILAMFYHGGRTYPTKTSQALDCLDLYLLLREKNIQYYQCTTIIITTTTTTPTTSTTIFIYC